VFSRGTNPGPHDWRLASTAPARAVSDGAPPPTANTFGRPIRPGAGSRECGALGCCSPAVTSGVLAALGALVLATAVGLWWRARNGRVVAKASAPVESAAASTESVQEPAELTARDLGAELGGRATLVQFSSAFCAPCRATRQILGEVAKMVEGVKHIEIDAESRLDLVRRLDVRRTPTTFVLGPDWHVTHRASGQPRKADVIAALGAMVEFPI